MTFCSLCADRRGVSEFARPRARKGASNLEFFSLIFLPGIIEGSEESTIMPLRRVLLLVSTFLLSIAAAVPAFAQKNTGGEANLVLPDLRAVTFLNAVNGSTLLMGRL